MKQLIIKGAIFSSLLICTGAFAQNSKVVSAYNYLKYEELDKAQAAIDEAVTDAETAAKAKPWVYRGQIYYKIATTKDEKYKSLSPDALGECYTSFSKATELDVKGAYKEEISSSVGNLIILYSNAGVTNYSNKAYDKAMPNFERAAEISKKFFGKSDTLNLFNAALSAELSKNWDKSIELNQRLIEFKAGGPQPYRSISEAYKNKGNEAEAVAILQKGRVAFPGDGNLILAELDFYLQKGKDKEAMENLNLAIQKDPTNPVLYGVLANVFDRMANATPAPANYADLIQKAEANYKKAIELKADYFDALYNLGAMYYNKAVSQTNEANNLPLKEKAKYDKLNGEAEANFKASLPFLEKALSVNPKDKNTMMSLKQLYMAMNMNDKAKEIDAMMK